MRISFYLFLSLNDTTSNQLNTREVRENLKIFKLKIRISRNKHQRVDLISCQTNICSSPHRRCNSIRSVLSCSCMNVNKNHVEAECWWYSSERWWTKMNMICVLLGFPYFHNACEEIQHEGKKLVLSCALHGRIYEYYLSSVCSLLSCICWSDANADVVGLAKDMLRYLNFHIHMCLT